MRIIQSSRKTKTGSKASKSPDSEFELGSFSSATSLKEAPTTQLLSECSLGKEAMVSQFDQQMPNGKRRRRSEIDPKLLQGLGADSCKPLGSAPVDESKKEFDRLLATAVRLLAMREHSVKEMTHKLLARSQFADIVYAVVDELLTNKYVSDERFAESYVRFRSSKGFGPVKIRAELKSKGISNPLIEEHLNMSSDVWFEHAQNQHQKKYGDAPVSDYNVWTKRARFMQSRGFTMEHIHTVIQRPEFD